MAATKRGRSARAAVVVVVAALGAAGLFMFRAGPQESLGTAAGPAVTDGPHRCPAPHLSDDGVQTIVDYTDSVRLGGRTYERLTGPDPTPADLGGPVATTLCRLADAGDLRYTMQDRDAAILPVGTPLLEVTGFDPAFRIATLTSGVQTLYEVRFPSASSRTGADVFPSVGRHVVALAGLSIDDGTQLRRSTDPVLVADFVAGLMAAPVKLDRRDLSSPADGFVGLVLDDGTTVRRTYHGAQGVLDPGVTLPAALRPIAAGLLER